MESLPIAGENGFVDFSVTANGTETNYTQGVDIPAGFQGWVRCEVKGRVTTGDAETGIWLGNLKITAVRIGAGSLDIKAASAHLPGWDFVSGNASNYEIALVKMPSDPEKICLSVGGGAEGDSADFDARFFITGSRP